MIKKIILIFSFCALMGCDFVYGVLQKEGAQEKKILGNVTPSIYSEKVEQAQKLLLIHGASPGKIDGKLGGKMRDAIAKFQTSQGLPVTRFVDNKTWEALNVFSATGLVVNGDLNFTVVQEVLKKAGFYSGKIDGKPGPRTAEAVKEFQRSCGLKADGRIGPKTMLKLNEFLLAR